MPNGSEIAISDCKRSVTGIPSAGNPVHLESTIMKRGDSTEIKGTGGKMLTSLS